MEQRHTMTLCHFYYSNHTNYLILKRCCFKEKLYWSSSHPHRFLRVNIAFRPKSLCEKQLIQTFEVFIEVSLRCRTCAHQSLLMSWTWSGQGQGENKLWRLWVFFSCSMSRSNFFCDNSQITARCGTECASIKVHHLLRRSYFSLSEVVFFSQFPWVQSIDQSFDL